MATKARTAERIWPNVAIPPGDTLKELLEFIGMAPDELARRIGRDETTVNQICNGTATISERIALDLEAVLGTPARVWIDLEKNFQLNRSRLEGLERSKSEGVVAQAKAENLRKR